MKKIQVKYSFFAIAVILALSACKKEFIDLTPKGQFLAEFYYSDKDQAFGGLVGVYDVLRKNAGGFENMIT
ncbi:MAG TPA: RagB/SusD family nutrient uptake outer membrane protein, partial [Hanamia sp.]|nr:RagB/SusD family nutrient uptake outer membrane protein [Hanamia sp.]